MGCINREVGNTPVEPGFADATGRPKWAIPWMEDDPGMTIPQLWAGRMRRDAADALQYGCTGLMGIHWRTRILSPNVSALAKAAWDQSGWIVDVKNAGKTDLKLPEGVEGGQLAQFPNFYISSFSLNSLQLGYQVIIVLRGKLLPKLEQFQKFIS